MKHDEQQQRGDRAVGADEGLAERGEDELAERARRGREAHRQDRRAGGTSRANAASTIVNEAPERPKPSSTPPVRLSAAALVLI